MPGDQLPDQPSRPMIINRIGLIGGPLLAALVYAILPDSYTDAGGATVAFDATGRATLAVMAWMGLWWLTEAINISATAMLPIVLFPMLGIADITSTTASYAHPLIFLFLGGFVLALSMQRWGLDRRIAMLTLGAFGTRPANMIAGFMITTAVLSAFVSNTATAAMMLPIAVSVVALRAGSSEGEIDWTSGHNRFATCLMLAIAYSASIGGVATIIGSPPNALLVGFLSEGIATEHRIEVSFVRWMMLGVPLAAVFLPIAWLVLTRWVQPVPRDPLPGGRKLIAQQRRALGPAKRGEWITFIVFCCTALLWITRPWLSEITLALGEGEIVQPLAGLSDAGIAIAGALVLFVIPVNWRRAQFAMNWETAARLPWGILILFGGGLSLAAAVQANGVTDYFGSLAMRFGGLSPILVIALVTAGVVFLTELTSNTATAAALIPILAALATGLGVHPYALVFPVAFAASCAFMMPVATPPNAIVFGSSNVTIGQMVRAGLWLNMIAIVLITLLTALVCSAVLGFELRFDPPTAPAG